MTENNQQSSPLTSSNNNNTRQPIGRRRLFSNPDDQTTPVMTANNKGADKTGETATESSKLSSSATLPRRVTYDVMEKWYFVGNETDRSIKNKKKKIMATSSSDNNSDTLQQPSPAAKSTISEITAVINNNSSNILLEKDNLLFDPRQRSSLSDYVEVPSPIPCDDLSNNSNRRRSKVSERASISSAVGQDQQNLFVEKSFFYFTRENPFRKAAVDLITWRWFERFSIFVIVVNCVTLGAVDPCEGDVCITMRCSALQLLDHAIFVFFAVEMLIKMLAMGITGKHSYLSDSWNRLDCFIVVAGVAEYLFVMENINLSSIRTIRVLRPLRAINRIPSLRLLVMLLLDTLPMLGNVLLICFFVFFVFGIAGVQLWAGVLRQRCFFRPSSSFEMTTTTTASTPLPVAVNTESSTSDYSTSPSTASLFLSYSPPSSSSYQQLQQQASSPSPSAAASSLYYPSYMPPYYRPPQHDYVCSPSAGILRCHDIPKYEHYDSMCIEMFGNGSTQTLECKWWADNYTECLPLGPNPARGTISFDNIGLAWVAIFQVISLEGWTEVMYLIQDAYSFWVWLYFVTLIIIGAFFAVNLCLVVIATQFSETKRRELAKMKQERRAAAAISPSSSTLHDSNSVARMSQGSSSFTTGQSNIYTQMLDVIGHFIRVGVRWVRRRRLRSRRPVAAKSPTSDEDRQRQLLSTGLFDSKQAELCSACLQKLRERQQQAGVETLLMKPPSSQQLESRCSVKEASTSSFGDTAFETPGTSPFEGNTPIASRKFTDIEQSTNSNDVFLSVGSETGW